MALTTFTVTFYCACILCTGHTHGITKSKQPAITSYTLACAPEKLHRMVYLEGYGYRHCTDTGGKRIRGNRLDMYVFSHEEAIHLGTKKIRGRWLPKWRR